MEQKSIWAVFSIENNYDQPRNNLVIFWNEKPEFEIFLEAMDVKLDPAKTLLQLLRDHGDTLYKLRRVYDGFDETWSETNFRLEEVKPGISLKQ